MAANEIHVGDTGTVLTVTIYDGETAVNISGATTKQIILSKPDGTALTKAAAFVTDGADGKLSYTTIAGDLDTPGTWSLAAYVVLSTGAWHSDIVNFFVKVNL